MEESKKSIQDEKFITSYFNSNIDDLAKIDSFITLNSLRMINTIFLFSDFHEQNLLFELNNGRIYIDVIDLWPCPVILTIDSIFGFKIENNEIKIFEEAIIYRKTESNVLDTFYKLYRNFETAKFKQYTVPSPAHKSHKIHRVFLRDYFRYISEFFCDKI